MRKIILTCFLLLFINKITYCQHLDNSQLIKVYSLLNNSLKANRIDIKSVTVSSLNKYIGSLSPNWGTIRNVDGLIQNDTEVYYHYNYKVANQIRSFIIATHKTTSKGIVSSVQYFTPNVREYNSCLDQIARIGYFFYEEKNEDNGVDKFFKVRGMTYIFSTFPPTKTGFKLYEKPVLLYAIRLAGKPVQLSKN